MTTSVFCTSTSTPTDGSTRDSSSTTSTAWKKRAARAAVRVGNLDAHDAQIEQLVDESPGNLGVLVHLADERADLGVGELPHAVAKEPLVFGQACQRGRQGFGGRGGHDPEWYHWLSVPAAPAPGSAPELQTVSS